MAQFLRIREWARFQHYKDRDPPWIKLHRELLTSQTWVSLDDASRVLAIALMLLAAGTDNKIPADAGYLKRVAYLNADPDWRPLLKTGFVDLIDENGEVASKALAPATECASEERRGRAEESRGEQRSVELKLDDGPVDRVFAHWRQEFKHPKATLDPKRRRAIQAALKAYDEATVIASLSGYRNSPHHMGQNEQRTVYDEIGLFLRDAEHVEKGLQFARAPPQPAKSAVELARENLQRSMNGGRNGSVVSEQNGHGESGVGSLARVLR